MSSRDQVALLADVSVAPTLRDWLVEAGYDVTQLAGSADQRLSQGGSSPPTSRARRMSGLVGRRQAPIAERTLITYYGTAEETEAAVTTALLGRLPRHALWLQLGPMVLYRAWACAARAASVDVRLLHAPYLQRPSRRGKPGCVVYGPSRVTSRGGADALVRALSSYATWVGPLDHASSHRDLARGDDGR